MGTCVLIAQGYDPEEAMKLVTKRRTVADPYIYYIRSRIMKFARKWEELAQELPGRRQEGRGSF
jgi:hypothetical protein